MIITGVLKIVFYLIQGIFSFIPDIPPFPDDVNNLLVWFTNSVSSVIGFINAIFPLQLALRLILFVVAIKNIKIMKKLFIWIIKKIPFLGIK